MFDPDDRSWLEHSVNAPNAEIDVSFFVSSEFHKDPNKLDEEPLQLPILGCSKGDARFISLADALAEPNQLIEYYKAVLSLAAEHSQTYDDFCTHFWMRLGIASSAGEIGFSWYDHFQEIDGVLKWLISAPDGDQWHDLEQGWEIIATRIGAKFHFREGLFDQGGELENLAFSRDVLSAAARETRTMFSKLMPTLVNEIGEDYWTRYRHDLSSHGV